MPGCNSIKLPIEYFYRPFQCLSDNFHHFHHYAGNPYQEYSPIKFPVKNKDSNAPMQDPARVCVVIVRCFWSNLLFNQFTVRAMPLSIRFGIQEEQEWMSF
jgi:hypothetical protein